MEVVLDTNFVISCIRKKIDFIDQLKTLGFKIVVPREVFHELKDLKKESKVSQSDRIAINLALEMFEKEKIKKITLGERIVDEGLIKKGKEGVYIASIDAGVRKNVPNRVVIDSARKSVAVERG
tara:strand:+ start:435 stop:806 length:372 start_codon:yes stop_codon:yes gene_type:complete